MLFEPFPEIGVHLVADRLLYSDDLIDFLSIQSVADPIKNPHDLG